MMTLNCFRFVTSGGPSVNKLMPGDQILAIDGEDVKGAPRQGQFQYNLVIVTVTNWL